MAILHGGHLLLLLNLLLLCLLSLLGVGELGGIEMGRTAHEGGGIHHGSGRVRIVHMWEAVAIMVGDRGFVHPGAHG